jgi:3-oxoadipate enol-lactonase
MKSFRNAGITLHYRWTPGDGAGPVIVLVNSLGTDFRIWDDVTARLGGVASVLAYDKRGHGLSDLGAAPMTMAGHTGDLAALIDHLRIGKAIICGLSVGGQIALRLAAERTGLVDGLILCDTAPKIGNAEIWNARIDAVKRNGISSIAGTVLARWFTPAFRRDDNPAFALARNMLLRQSPEGYAATCGAIRDTDFTEIAGNLTVPALCIVGSEDGATPPALVEDMARIIPDSTFRVIENCGHIPCIERPEELAGLIAEFITKHVSGKNRD